MLLSIGEPLGDFTDGIGLTGEDSVLPCDRKVPTGAVLFAGPPRATSERAPRDLILLDRGEFLVAWSPRLRHPVWCAYHVPAEVLFEVGKRPNFKADANAPNSPTASVYKHTGYDRGHMVPNYASVTRFGPELQAKTFLMSNITPQTKELNRGVWRELEHSIADFWTRKWGEIWVIVGCLSESKDTLIGTDIDIPTRFYQLVVAQQDDRIRAFATLFERKPSWDHRLARYLVTIDELEELTGFDFLSELDDELEEALESKLPSRLWPVHFPDAFSLLARISPYEAITTTTPPTHR